MIYLWIFTTITNSMKNEQSYTIEPVLQFLVIHQDIRQLDLFNL